MRIDKMTQKAKITQSNGRHCIFLVFTMALVACSPTNELNEAGAVTKGFQEFLVDEGQEYPRSSGATVSSSYVSCKFAPTAQEWRTGQRSWSLPCTKGSGEAWAFENEDEVIIEYRLSDGTTILKRYAS